MTDFDTSLKLIDLFKANLQQHWYFVRPGGNWGDHLIYSGAESLARALGLRWTDLDYSNVDSGRLGTGACIYLHGSGGFNSWGSGRALKNLCAALKVPGTLVVQGPQSCAAESDGTMALLDAALKEAKSSEVHFFARERKSAQVLTRTLPSSVMVHLDHDTAFHLSEKDLLTLSGLKESPKGRYTLIVSREDHEAPLSPLNLYIDGISLDPAFYASSFRHWLRIHAFSSRIISNRLHSAIVGSLFGKPTELLPGSYHKNHSVWEFSLRERGVTWREQPEGKPGSKSLFERLPAPLSRSWKVRAARLWMCGVPLK